MTTVTVSSAAELRAAFALAAGGDRIELLPGLYDSVRLAGRSFDRPVTITSAEQGDRAVLTDRLRLIDVDNVVVEGIDLEAASLASFYYSRVQVNGSQNVALRDMTVQGHLPTANEGVDPEAPETRRRDVITGYGLETGLQIRGSQNVSVESVEFFDLRRAVSLLASDDLLLQGLDIHHVREGINLVDLRRVEIAESTLRDFEPWNPSRAGDHPDMIQYWGTNAKVGVHDVTIRDNLFYQPEGSSFTQTIQGHMRDAPDGVTATNWVVTGNVIGNKHMNALRLADIEGLEITDNILLPSSPKDSHLDWPLIIIPHSTDVLVEGNTLMGRRNGGVFNEDPQDLADRRVVLGENRFLSNDPDDPDYWIHEAVGRLPGFGNTPDGEPEPAPEPRILRPEDIPQGDARAVVEGTEDRDRLSLGGEDAFLFGHDGRDRLFTGKGNDYLVGGDGGDQFVFGYRGESGPQASVIADLDFDAGDTLRPLTTIPGLFTDSADPDNYLQVLSDGASILIDSLADLREARLSGALDYAAGPSGDSLLVGFAAIPGASIEILSLSPDDIQL